MNIIINTKRYVIYLFFFTLNFESLNLFNFGINYLATKISVSLLILVYLLNLQNVFNLKHFAKYLTPIALYFFLLTVVSFTHKSFLFPTFFDFQFFLNVLIFLILVSLTKRKPDILFKALFAFALGTFILSILYVVGFQITDSLGGRYTVFGMNQNVLGLNLSISVFVIVSTIIENKFQWKKKYLYYLLLTLPFLINFLVNTGSRVAFISLVLGLLLFLYFNRTIKTPKKIWVLGISLLAATLTWLFFLQDSIIGERLLSSVHEGDLANRDIIWLSLVDSISDNFILGIGKTGYAMQFGEGSPHNVILEVLCYSGIIGLTIFLVFLYRIWHSAYIKNKYQNELLSLTLFVPILGMVLSSQIFDQKIAWGLFAYIVSNSSKNKSTDLVV